MAEKDALRAVLVDDEGPALRELAYLLTHETTVKVVGQHKDPLAALAAVEKDKPNLVFLDIHMPQMQGMKLADRIMQIDDSILIVFVTAYDRYAVDAFEINALDYLLKPIEPQRLKATVSRASKRLQSREKPTGKTLAIRCFGWFRIGWEGQEPIKWRAEKTRELFAYLVVHAHRHVTKDELLERLWPGSDPKKALRQLYNGIYYVRQALADAGVDRKLIAIDADYNLNIGPIFLDVWHFEKMASSWQTACSKQLEEIDTLYQDGFLTAEGYEWASGTRQRLASLHAQTQLRRAHLYWENGRVEDAVDVWQKVRSEDPYDEETTERLVEAYLRLGQKTKAIRIYQEHARLLDQELGIRPGKELRRLIETAK